jgi:hypothetical protein
MLVWMFRQCLLQTSLFALLAGLVGCSDSAANSSSGSGGSATTAAAVGSGGNSSATSSGAGAGGGATTPSHCYDGMPTATAEGVGLRLDTPHYRIYSELDAGESDTVARLLEASYTALMAYFQVPPNQEGQLLACKIYASKQAWQAGMIQDGVNMPPDQAGGYFDPGTRTAYLYRQPTTYYTRVLAVHEVTHQFHLLGRAANAGKLPSWYVEGLAEHLARHDWDGRCVRLGVIPLLSQTDLPNKAKDEVQQGGLNLSDLLNNDPGSRPRAWATVSYFRHAQNGELREQFAAFEKTLEAGPKAGAAQIFETEIGPLSNYNAPIEAWLNLNQQPLQPVFLEWIHQGPNTLRGFASGVLSLARLKTAATQFNARYSGSGEAGLLLGFDDSAHFDAVVRRQDGSLQLFTAKTGGATWSASLASIPAAPSYALSLERTGPQDVSISINGQSLAISHQFTASSGLSIHDSDVAFEELSFQ